MLPDGTYGVKAGTALYLEDIVIPELYNGVSVTQILPYAFKEAYNLKSISIPDTITNIAEYAFYGCSSLETAIQIPDTMNYVAPYTFYNCGKISEITIPNTIKEIGTYAFYNCASLSQITIPANTEKINPYAFYGCSSANVTFVNTKYLWKPSCTATGDKHSGNYIAYFYSFADSDYAKSCLTGTSKVKCYGSNNNNTYHTTTQIPSTVTLYKSTYTSKPDGYI